jgi:four helix bundle protein
MAMKGQDFRDRTKRFAVDVIRLCEKLPHTTAAQILARQALRSACSIAGNYREACRARSKDEFISKMGTCEQEADETQLWLELLRDGCDVDNKDLERLLIESEEILAIVVSMINNAKRNRDRRKQD